MTVNNDLSYVNKHISVFLHTFSHYITVFNSHSFLAAVSFKALIAASSFTAVFFFLAISDFQT